MEPTDEEADQTWLAGLRALNAHVAAAGDPLAGNLCYEHLDPDFRDAAPSSLLRTKRDRMRSAVAGRRRLLEVGVNGGHSAYVALTSNPDLEFHGVDICEHNYVRPAVEHLKTAFPGRVHFYSGSCLDILPQLARQGMEFDLFHIDGAKDTYFADVLNSTELLADDGAVLVLDDTQQVPVERLWMRCVAEGILAPHPDFPSMQRSEPFRNEIGHVSSLTTSRRRQLFVRYVYIPRRIRSAKKLARGPVKRLLRR